MKKRIIFFRSNALSQLWAGLLLIGFGLIITLPSLVTGIYFPVYSAVSLIIAGMAVIILDYLFTGKEFRLVKYMTGGILLTAGFVLIMYRASGIPVVSIIFGSSLLITSMVLIWYGVMIRLRKGWINILVSGITTMALGLLMLIQWNGVDIFMRIANGLILIFPGIQLVLLGNSMNQWEHELFLQWDDEYQEEIKTIRNEFFSYRSELLDIQVAIMAIREILNDKLNKNEMDYRLLQLSGLVSDLQEELETVKKMAERLSDQIRKNDSVADMAESRKMQQILQEIREKYNEVLQDYRNNINLN
jgi:uncharacterized membrane protein HdeD (DUF308 family)